MVRNTLRLRLFLHLLKLGYKEIEAGHRGPQLFVGRWGSPRQARPTSTLSARAQALHGMELCSERPSGYIIDEGLIPDDVWIQVLSRAVGFRSFMPPPSFLEYWSSCEHRHRKDLPWLD